MSKFCRQRNWTPEMLFRMADRKMTGEIDQNVWKSTLLQLGLKLSQEQLTKMIMLIDEDLSGKVSVKEYYDYLSAFNIRGEETKDEPFVVGGMDKIRKALIEKTINVEQITKVPAAQTPTDDGMSPTKRRKAQDRHKYMTYEEFYTFCKKQLPKMKQKQIASIFNRLDPDNTGLASIEQLKALLKKSEKSEQQLEKKNDRRKRPTQKKKTDAQVPLDHSELLLTILKMRVRRGLFHLGQFKNAAKILNRKNDILELYRDIDQQRLGSFDYNQILTYWLMKKSSKDSYDAAYQIMQMKLANADRKIEQVLFLLKMTDVAGMTPAGLSQFLKTEFSVPETHSKLMFQALCKEYNLDQLEWQHLVMKFHAAQRTLRDQMKKEIDFDDIIPLNEFGTKRQDYLKKGMGTMVMSPMLMLKFCVQLERQLQKRKKNRWQDMEFGPIPQDPKGIESLLGIGSTPLIHSFPSQEEITWKRCSDMNLQGFYNELSSFNEGKFKDTPLLAAMAFIMTASPQSLFSQFVNHNKQIQQLTQLQYDSAFCGIYPRIFHHFSQYGMYVFRFFIEDRWVYVLIDDLLPCTISSIGTDILSATASNKSTWVSLIEKAYAKVKGGYYSLHQQLSFGQCLYELSRQIPRILSWEKLEKKQEKDGVWKKLIEVVKLSLVDSTKLFCLNSSNNGVLQQKEFKTSWYGYLPIQLSYIIELGDDRSQNYHKSHRLVILKHQESTADSEWNTSWSQHLPDNKLTDMEDYVKDQLRKHPSKIVLPQTTVVNYAKWRQLFRQVVNLQNLVRHYGQRMRDELTQVRENKYKIRMNAKGRLTIVIQPIGDFRIEYELNFRNQTRTVKDSLAVISDQIEEGDHILTIRCRDALRYSLTIYAPTRIFKIGKENGRSQFKTLTEDEKINYDRDMAGDKAMEFIEKRIFNVVPKKFFKCC